MTTFMLIQMAYGIPVRLHSVTSPVFGGNGLGPSLLKAVMAVSCVRRGLNLLLHISTGK